MKDKEKLVSQLIEEIDNHTPWLWPGSPWKTESQYWSWLRGSLRSIWSRKWIFKNNYLRDHTFPYPVSDKNGNPKYYKTGKRKGERVTQKHFKCEITNEVFPVKEGQVDHISPSGSLTNGLEACIFLFRLLTSPNNMRLISKDAHAIITYMEKNGLSWEEAVIDKKVINKLKQKVEFQKKELISYGFSELEISNKEKRKQCYKKYLKNNS